MTKLICADSESNDADALHYVQCQIYIEHWFYGSSLWVPKIKTRNCSAFMWMIIRTRQRAGNQHLFTIIKFTMKPITSVNISKIKNKKWVCIYRDKADSGSHTTDKQLCFISNRNSEHSKLKCSFFS